MIHFVNQSLFSQLKMLYQNLYQSSIKGFVVNWTNPCRKVKMSGVSICRVSWEFSPWDGEVCHPFPPLLEKAQGFVPTFGGPCKIHAVLREPVEAVILRLPRFELAFPIVWGQGGDSTETNTSVEEAWGSKLDISMALIL